MGSKDIQTKKKNRSIFGMIRTTANNTENFGFNFQSSNNGRPIRLKERVHEPLNNLTALIKTTSHVNDKFHRRIRPKHQRIQSMEKYRTLSRNSRMTPNQSCDKRSGGQRK